MGRFYVNITGISQDTLDFLGYPCFAEDEEFKILYHKGELFLVDKKGTSYLYVDDKNDADLLKGAFAIRKKIPFPTDGKPN
jgi:hypothetical protein